MLRVPVLLGLMLLIAAGCRSPRPAAEGRGDSTAADSGLNRKAPRIREATVVAFWLRAADTLGVEEAHDFRADFAAAMGRLEPLLKEAGIHLVTTGAESMEVLLQGGPSRTITLSGLDYPFGFVLVEPGYPETILTGPMDDEDLADQVNSYFGLDGDSDDGEGRGPVVVAAAARNPPAPHAGFTVHSPAGGCIGACAGIQAGSCHASGRCHADGPADDPWERYNRGCDGPAGRLAYLRGSGGG